MNDLPATRNDSASFKQTVSSFGVDLKDSGKDGVYIREDPKTKDHHKLLADIKERLSSEPQQKICILWMLAGHGGVSDGIQCMVHNEYKEQTRWYVVFRAEYFIRAIATKFSNSY